MVAGQKFITTKPKQRPLWQNYDMWSSIVLVVNCLAILFIRNPGFGGASVFMAKVPFELMTHLPIRIDPKFPHPEYRNLTHLRRRAFCNGGFVGFHAGPKALQNVAKGKVRDEAYLNKKPTINQIKGYKKDSMTDGDGRVYDYLYLGFRKHSVCQLMPQTGLTEGSCWGIKKLNWCLGLGPTPAGKWWPKMVHAARVAAVKAAAAKKAAAKAKAVADGKAAASAVVSGSATTYCAQLTAAKYGGLDGDFTNALITALGSDANKTLLIDHLSDTCNVTRPSGSVSDQLDAIFAKTTTTAAPTTTVSTASTTTKSTVATTTVATVATTTEAPSAKTWPFVKDANKRNNATYMTLEKKKWSPSYAKFPPGYKYCGEPNFCELIKFGGKFREIAEIGKAYMWLYLIGMVPIFLMLFDPPPAFWHFDFGINLDMHWFAFFHPYLAAILMTSASACGFTWFFMQKALLEEVIDTKLIREAYPGFEFMFGYGISFVYNLIPTTLTAIIFWVLIFCGVKYPRFPSRLKKRRQRFEEEYKKLENQTEEFLEKHPY